MSYSDARIVLKDNSYNLLVLGTPGLLSDWVGTPEATRNISVTYAALGEVPEGCGGGAYKLTPFDSRNQELVKRFYDQLKFQEGNFDFLLIAIGFESFDVGVDELSDEILSWCCVREINKMAFSLKFAPICIRNLRSIIVLLPAHAANAMASSMVAWAREFFRAAKINAESVTRINCLTIQDSRFVTREETNSRRIRSPNKFAITSLLGVLDQCAEQDGEEFVLVDI